MARSKKPSPRSIVLRQDVEIKVTEVALKPFDSIQYLDAARLSRAAHARFEVGTIESACCHRTVHAVVRKGMVTKLEIEPCKKTVRLTPDMQHTIQAALKKLAPRRSGTTSLPVPVSQFLAARIGLRFTSWMCFKICCFGHCMTCCYHIRIGGSNWILWAGCAIDDFPTM